jgi:hypothetical protein
VPITGADEESGEHSIGESPPGIGGKGRGHCCGPLVAHRSSHARPPVSFGAGLAG